MIKLKDKFLCFKFMTTQCKRVLSGISFFHSHLEACLSLPTLLRAHRPTLVCGSRVGKCRVDEMCTHLSLLLDLTSLSRKGSVGTSEMCSMYEQCKKEPLQTIALASLFNKNIATSKQLTTASRINYVALDLSCIKQRLYYFIYFAVKKMANNPNRQMRHLSQERKKVAQKMIDT